MGSSSSSPLMAIVISLHLLNITITVIVLFFVYCNMEKIIAVAAFDIIQATALDLHHVDHEEISHSFDENFYVMKGNDHVFYHHHGNVIQLNFDKYSGSSFGSRNRYASGYFHLRMRVPGGKSAGSCTTFHMTSPRNTEVDAHDEVEFEFLGSKNGRPHSLQTNVITNGTGGREEVINLWFDPSADFHTYKILWNPHQIVFYVDNTPIRVYRNRTEVGAGYPAKPMQVQGSIRNCSELSHGGHLLMNWRVFPLKALYRGFIINDGCVSNIDTFAESCYSDQFWWNRENRWTLTAREQRLIQGVRNRYRIYDYCTDNARYPIPSPECLP